MTTRKTLLAFAIIAAVSAFPFAASAATVNPEKDSAALFPFNVTPATAAADRAPTSRVVGSVPARGEVSSDGSEVYSGSDSGWVPRSHSYAIAAGGFVHAADCPRYDTTKFITAQLPVNGKGLVADH